jgi:hypothetical protein
MTTKIGFRLIISKTYFSASYRCLISLNKELFFILILKTTTKIFFENYDFN